MGINKINKERLVKTFFELVRIDSESSHELEFANHLLDRAKNLGYDSWMDKYWNVYVSVPGKGESLMINTHMDTVRPGKSISPQLETINGEEYITSAGNTILGADPKATIAALFEVLALVKEENISTNKLVLTFSCQEEEGQPTAKYIEPLAKLCVVPDRAAPLGEIILQSPFAQVYKVHVHGKAAYATTNFADGIHAIQAAVAMLKNVPLGNISSETVSNIGIVQGGEMTTAVPDYAWFKGNCYSFSKFEFEAFFTKLHEIVERADKKFGTTSEIEFLEYFPGYETDGNEPLLQKIAAAMAESGLDLKTKKYMAVSNANILNEIGIKSVLISYAAENTHTTSERISTANLLKLTKLLYNLAI